MGAYCRLVTVEEDVAAAQFQSRMKNESKQANRGQQHGKKEPTVAYDNNDSASMEDVAVASCRLVTVEEEVAAAQIQSQIKNESKKADRGQQHGKKEPTVAYDTNDSASVEYLAGVKEDVAVASCRLVI